MMITIAAPPRPCNQEKTSEEEGALASGEEGRGVGCLPGRENGRHQRADRCCSTGFPRSASTVPAPPPPCNEEFPEEGWSCSSPGFVPAGEEVG